MMYLNFKCNLCEHNFIAFDQYKVLCPKCHKSDVQVVWDKDAKRKDLIIEIGNKVADRNNEALKRLDD